MWQGRRISRGSSRVGSANSTWASTTKPKAGGGAGNLRSAALFWAAGLVAFPSPLFAGSYLQRETPPPDSSARGLIVGTSPPRLPIPLGEGEAGRPPLGPA